MRRDARREGSRPDAAAEATLGRPRAIELHCGVAAAGIARRRAGSAFSAIGLLGPLVLVTAQVLVNFRTGRISDLDHLYFAHRLYQHPFPYLDARIEYPVLTGSFMTAAAALTHGAKAYLVLSSVGLWACAVGCTCVLWSLSRRAAWCFALCPLLLVYSLLNWDLLAILLMLLGWRAWTRDRYCAAAMWLALGAFAKLYPAFLLVFCLVELASRWRSGLASTRDVARFVAAAAAVATIVNVPFILIAFHNWLYFWSFNVARNQHADLLSWLHLLNDASLGTTNASLAAVVIAAVAIGALAICKGARVIHVAAVVFFVFMLMQKVNSPQYTLWLVAFALMADWEPWTIAVLSMMGLTDYANSVIHIALVQQHATFVRWYELQIYPLDQGLRLLTTLIVAVAVLHRAAHPGLALERRPILRLESRLRSRP